MGLGREIKQVKKKKFLITHVENCYCIGSTSPCMDDAARWPAKINGVFYSRFIMTFYKVRGHLH